MRRGKAWSWLERDGPHSATVRVTPSAARQSAVYPVRTASRFLDAAASCNTWTEETIHSLFPVLGLRTNLPRRDLRLTDMAQGVYRTANRGVVGSNHGFEESLRVDKLGVHCRSRVGFWADECPAARIRIVPSAKNRTP